MYREIILIGYHMMAFSESLTVGKYQFRIEYDSELALAGLPPYYVHRSRYKGDTLKNPRIVSELPIPAPAVMLGGSQEDITQYFADVVLASTFNEALSFLGQPYTTLGGGLPMHLFRAEREKIDRDAQIAHEDEKVKYENTQPGQLRMLF